MAGKRKKTVGACIQGELFPTPKSSILSFLDENFESILAEDLPQLEPKDRLDFMYKLLRLVTPKPPQEQPPEPEPRESKPLVEWVK